MRCLPLALTTMLKGTSSIMSLWGNEAGKGFSLAPTNSNLVLTYFWAIICGQSELSALQYPKLQSCVCWPLASCWKPSPVLAACKLCSVLGSSQSLDPNLFTDTTGPVFHIGM